MKWYDRTLFSYSSVTLTAVLFLLLAPAPAPVTLHGQAGQLLTLTVRLPALSTGVLLNRGAPNSVTLKTPWGQTKKQPAGQPFPKDDKEFSDYFQQLQPITLKLKVPAGTPSGPHNAQLALHLFTCDKKERLCKQKDLTYPVTIHVGKMQRNATLNVPAALFRQTFKLDGSLRPSSLPSA